MTFGLQTNNNLIKKKRKKKKERKVLLSIYSIFVRPFDGDKTKTKCFSTWQVKEFDMNLKVKITFIRSLI